MSARPTSPFPGLRVLIVEDDWLIFQFLREVLLDRGCTVVGPARNVDEALRAIRTDDIDGALLDVQLGSASIYPVANELALRGIPFILTTGGRDLGGYPPLLREAPLLTKPFKVQQLEDLMSRSFGRRDRGVHADAASACAQSAPHVTREYACCLHKK